MGGDADRARARDLAFAEALLGLSRVAATLSTSLRAVHAEESPDDAPVASGVEGAPGPLPAADPRLGPRQLRVLEVDGLSAELGLAAADVAVAAGLTAPNASAVLGRLAELSLLERVAGQRPARWRRSGGLALAMGPPRLLASRGTAVPQPDAPPLRVRAQQVQEQ